MKWTIILRPYQLYFFCWLLFTGCFTAVSVDEDYCENNQHLIACFGGEIVWDAALNTCRCVCDEGKWGDRCEYNASSCKGTIVTDPRDGTSTCDCATASPCVSKFIYVSYDKFCYCTSPLFSSSNDDDEWLGGDLTDGDLSLYKNSHITNPDYLPLIVGQAWLYDVLDTAGISTNQWSMAIQDSFTRDDRHYFDIQLAFPDSSGLFNSVIGPLLYNSPDDTNQVNIYYSETQTGFLAYHQFPEPGNYVMNDDTITISFVGAVEVPAGIFNDCMAIEDPATSSSFIYAPNIGLIKVVNEGVDNMVLSDMRQGCTLTASASFTHNSCGAASNGSISIETYDPIGSLSYTWSGPTSIGNIPNPTNLEAGSYAVTISDQACTLVIPGITIQDSSSTLTISAEIQDVSCTSDSSGSINITVADGNEPYVYNWNNGTYNTEDLANLIAGSYTIVVMDSSGCTGEATFTVSGIAEMEIELIQAVAETCHGAGNGALDVSVSDGTPPFLFNWNEGLYDTEDILNLGSGTYALMVTDSAGCVVRDSFVIIAADTIKITLVNAMPLSCRGAGNGSMEVAITGGTGPYSLDWNNGQYNSALISRLDEGSYDLLVTDQNGCVAQQSFDMNIRESTIPMTLSVQGLLIDTTQTILPDDVYDLAFRLYPSLSGDSILWEEEQDDVAIVQGIFSAILGYITPLDLCFDQAYFLGIALNGTGEMTPRIELTAAPYSFMAKNVEDGVITTEKIKDMAVTPDKISIDILSGINGVKNDGGEITLLAGENIVITPDPSDHSITISTEGISADSLVTSDEIVPDIVSSISGVRNDGGDVNIVAGENITVTPNDSTNSITISAEAASIPDSVNIDDIVPDIVSSISGVRNDGGDVNIVAGENITVTPNDSTNSITISAEAESVPDSVNIDNIVPDIVSSISGVRNDGGDVNIVAGENITVTPNDTTNTITISATDPGIGLPASQLWFEQDQGIAYLGSHASLLRVDSSLAGQMNILNDGTGYMRTTGPNGSNNIQLTSSSVNANNGFISIGNQQGNTRTAMYISSNDIGSIYTLGPNGNLNNFLTSLSGNPNNGLIAVYDAQGNSQAGMYVDGGGTGRFFADSYDTFINHPAKANTQIRSSLLQGLEAGIYLRGTANLNNGAGYIEFPEYFREIISEGKITVMITPLSAKSKGIAVVKKSISGFSVRELLEGVGSYEFDWEVKAIRKGHENFEVLKKTSPLQKSGEIENANRPKRN